MSSEGTAHAQDLVLKYKDTAELSGYRPLPACEGQVWNLSASSNAWFVMFLR